MPILSDRLPSVIPIYDADRHDATVTYDELAELRASLRRDEPFADEPPALPESDYWPEEPDSLWYAQLNDFADDDCPFDLHARTISELAWQLDSFPDDGMEATS